MAAEFKLELQNKKSGKCTKCKKPFESTEHVLGSAALYSEEDEMYGSTYWRHVKCAEKSQVLWLAKNYSKIKGWDGLQNDEQESIQEQFSEVLKAETPKKKKKGATKGKPKKRKAKKDDDDDDDVDDDDDDDKSKKKKKPKKEKKEVDKNAPKKPKTSYFLFMEANRADFKKEHPEAKPKELVKMLGDAWKSLNEEEKKDWADLYQKDKARYERQLKEYNETGKFTPEPDQEPKDQEPKEDDEAKQKPKKKLRKIAESEGEGEKAEGNKESETESDKDKEQQEQEQEQEKATDTTED